MKTFIIILTAFCAITIAYIFWAIIKHEKKLSRIKLGDYCFVYDEEDNRCQARITHIIYDDEKDEWLYRCEYIDSNGRIRHPYLNIYSIYF